jgi:hypothetical protein
MASWLSQILSFRREPTQVPLYFMHIPKTAGTTVDHMLRSRFPRRRANSTFNVVELMRLPQRKLAALEFISGHLEFGYYLEELLGRPVRAIAFVREPRPLLLSIYKQVIKDPADPVHAYVRANCPSIDQFFRDPVMSAYVANFQTRYVALAERRFDAATVEAVRQAPAHRIEGILRDAVAREQANTPSNAGLLQRATERLQACWFVGVTERLDESMARLAGKLGWKPFPPAPQINRSPHSARTSDLSKATLRRIDELTSLDRILYDRATEIEFGKTQRAAA